MEPKLTELISELLGQIHKGDYKDELGHSLKNNKALIDLEIELFLRSTKDPSDNN